MITTLAGIDPHMHLVTNVYQEIVAYQAFPILHVTWESHYLLVTPPFKGSVISQKKCRLWDLPGILADKTICHINSKFLLNPTTRCRSCRRETVYTYHRLDDYICWQCQLTTLT